MNVTPLRNEITDLRAKLQRATARIAELEGAAANSRVADFQARQALDLKTKKVDATHKPS